jgi:flavin reductase (DIM6/NTAB) family NADH-FMN oxidoreductase RutF
VHRIELRQDIADGQSQIHWRSLPSWSPENAVEAPPHQRHKLPEGKYTKGYNADYRFPSSVTVGFEHDEQRDGMAMLHLPTGVRSDEQIEVDDDRARWPCFFPSSVGMITTWVDGQPNLMPCGSTTVVSRHPLVIAPSISYRPINVRYAPRHTIDVVRRTQRFTCGVPYLDDELLDAMAYAGNVSFQENVEKVRDAGFAVEPNEWAPLLTALPVSYECEVIGEQELGTHAMVYGEVKRVLVRSDVTPENPLNWCPWPTVHSAAEE